MERRELVRLFVLDAICDDYENIDQVIVRDVAADGAKCGLTIDRTEVVAALAGLIEDGLAKAYVLSCWNTPAAELPGMPTVDMPEEDFKTYFYITKKGMDLHLPDAAGWPFDEEGNLRPDWTLDVHQT